MVAGLEERERIKETFGRFVSRDVAAAVLSGQLPLDGERREVTILFQDVRDFTTLAERTDPRILVRVVNRLFTEMVAAVEAQGGIIREFTGDGVMALFGAPVAHDDDPARAVRAALDMLARLPALNAHVAERAACRRCASASASTPARSSSAGWVPTSAASTTSSATRPTWPAASRGSPRSSGRRS